MNLKLDITPQEFKMIWSGLGEMPAKFVFATMENIKGQVVAQEKAASAAQSPVVSAQSPAVPSSPEAAPEQSAPTTAIP